jgi:glutaredoxin 3
MKFDHDIIVYTKTGCPWCIELMNWFAEHDLEFIERNVTQSDQFRKDMEQCSGQTKAPTVVIGEQIIADTDAQEIEQVLTELGRI